ncbi:putative dihydrodipicolinate synthase [Aspergillus pseudoustus]|uniref:Dihydrodipicolinate synthase n=1 Tax=Aspergillus pseudoustus TaxID=1810923 RepID=A0ABR4J5T0_9EURO
MRPLPTGIYTPLPCFFNENEDLDLEAFSKHVKFTAAGGTVPVVSGTMGEAVHLSHEERAQLVETARNALDEINLADVPVVAGAGAPSTRESIQLCREAAAAGADYVMVIPPGYYAGALLSDTRCIRDFFVQIAEASPVPVIIYNFPGVSSGIDMDSDLIIDIVKGSSNVCGVKLTCANVGKLTRIMAAVSAPEFETQYPRRFGFTFRAIDGFIDFLLPSISVGAAGAISGLPNIAPKICVKLWELCLRKEWGEAQKLQNAISLADGIALKIGIAGMKKVLHRRFGYGERPRLPLLPMADSVVEKVLDNPYWKELMELEANLE